MADFATYSDKIKNELETHHASCEAFRNIKWDLTHLLQLELHPESTRRPIKSQFFSEVLNEALFNAEIGSLFMLIVLM